jgi:hypothetical protein
MLSGMEQQLAAHERLIAETFARRRSTARRWWRGMVSWVAR